MAHKYQSSKFWTCDCDRTTGGHIIDGLYSTCVYCGKHRHELKEIVVPSGLGGVFCVEILSVEEDCAKVKVVKSSNGFDALPPFTAPFKDIAPRWKHKAGEIR